MKVAIVHEHLAQDGGAEKVVRYMQEMFPGSPIFTLVHDKKNANSFFADKDIRTSFLQRWPGGVKRYKWFLPFMPTAVESYDLKGFDVVLSSSSALAQGILTDPGTVHVCYSHTPARYLWTDTKSYVAELPHGRFIKSFLPFYLNYLRLWDLSASKRVDYFVANSQEVAKRIQKFYQRDSKLIYPPVETHLFQPGTTRGNYFLAGGRLVPYKRFDLIVAAFNRLGLPLKIFGDGPELGKLRQQATHANIEFLGRVSAETQQTLYQRCIAFIHPQVEDFGITMVEAMASGRPIIAYPFGGAREIVKEGISGTFFADQTWESLAETIIRFQPEKFDSARIVKEAENFSVATFKRDLHDFINQAWEKHRYLR